VQFARHVQPDKNDKAIVTASDNEVKQGSTGMQCEMREQKKEQSNNMDPGNEIK
jgi:hypothetical protein